MRGANQERNMLDVRLASIGIDETSRAALWSSAESILAKAEAQFAKSTNPTVLALGYVQSGKTTAITTLIAEAADAGYSIVIAMLGVTNLLLEQNHSRLTSAFDLARRTDYQWVSFLNPTGVSKAKELSDWLGRDRVVLLSVLKHSGRIKALTDLLINLNLESKRVLIIDDEADQASLNTLGNQGEESKTYAAISALRESIPNHLYVQFTATPYAPLLLDQTDHLSPDFVEFLEPGRGYTGGREFFIDNADIVVRPIPTLDEQTLKTLPGDLPDSLKVAFADFVAGSALLLAETKVTPPISMLVHSTHRNAVQERYHFMLKRLAAKWKDAVDSSSSIEQLPEHLQVQFAKFQIRTMTDIDPSDFIGKVSYVLSEATFWLVNSASDVAKVDWNVAPVHVLVGGNKLDRGFTVEGLTVTYMNRPASQQIDTIEQRARAFGYRGDLLPYCSFYATPRTLDLLREIVDTEYDLRARLRDCLDEGGSVHEWASDVGLLLPRDSKPARAAVISALSSFNSNPGWHQLRRPSLSHAVSNNQRVLDLGWEQAELVEFGRLTFKQITLPLSELLDRLLKPWQGAELGESPGWRHEDLVDALSRQVDSKQSVPVFLMTREDGSPRKRTWDPMTGFVNLMQGADADVTIPDAYLGDRFVGVHKVGSDEVALQIHSVKSRFDEDAQPIYALAIHAGSRQVVRKVT
jgi:hypothetical protein